MLGGGPVICGCGDEFCPGCDRTSADDEKCGCGRRLRAFPGEIELTCAGCGNKPDWCDCERPRTWESGHGEDDLAAGDGPVAERLGALRTALLTSAALDSIPPPSPVIDGMLYRDGLAWLHGRPASYKSFVALDWAGCVAAGLPWQERETSQCPVLYLIAEGTAGLRKRVRAWEDYADCTMLATFLPVPVQLLNPVDLTAFRALVAELAPGLVIVDTQARVTVGADENSAREMGQLVQAADAIRAACGACVLIVHHEGRAGENMRGSSALDGAATSIFRTAREGNRVTLENIRQRDVPEADDVQFHAIPRLDSIVLAGGQTSNWTFDEMADSEVKIRDALLDVFLDTGASPSNLIEVTKLPKSTAYWAIGQLVRRGSIVNTGTRKRPHYEAAQGNVQLSPTPSNPTSGPMSNVQPPFKGVGQLDSHGRPDETTTEGD